ncbi:MAG: cobalamin biosynthesis protein CbiX [Verrucomicrobiota bacterium]
MIDNTNRTIEGEFHDSLQADLIWLTDNGSLRPEATLSLRRLSMGVSQKLGREVSPVSLLHSSKIDPERLGGIEAKTFERSVKAAYEADRNNIWIQPLFFGPSAALTEYLPERIRVLSKKRPGLQVKIAPALVPNDAETPRWMLEVLGDFACMLLEKHPEISQWILLDHGSPKQAVAEVRDRVAADFKKFWSQKFPEHRVSPASMERRDGDAYAFSEPLLENVPIACECQQGDVGVLMLFFLPGRHAGPHGDVANIIKGVEERFPRLRMHMSALFCEHPKLVDILAEKIGG